MFLPNLDINADCQPISVVPLSSLRYGIINSMKFPGVGDTSLKPLFIVISI